MAAYPGPDSAMADCPYPEGLTTACPVLSDFTFTYPGSLGAVALCGDPHGVHDLRVPWPHVLILRVAL